MEKSMRSVTAMMMTAASAGVGMKKKMGVKKASATKTKMPWWGCVVGGGCVGGGVGGGVVGGGCVFGGVVGSGCVVSGVVFVVGGGVAKN